MPLSKLRRFVSKAPTRFVSKRRPRAVSDLSNRELIISEALNGMSKDEINETVIRALHVLNGHEMGQLGVAINRAGFIKARRAFTQGVDT